MPSNSNEIDEILFDLGAYKITTFDPTPEEYYAYYPELKRAKVKLESLIQKEVVKARIDEIRRILKAPKTVTGYAGDTRTVTTYIFEAGDITNRINALNQANKENK